LHLSSRRLPASCQQYVIEPRLKGPRFEGVRSRGGATPLVASDREVPRHFDPPTEEYGDAIL
jgi:hypothetical protein